MPSTKKQILRKVRCTIDGEAIFEAWVGNGPEWHWNSFVQPCMTEAQLDAFIAKQDPDLIAKAEIDPIYFDKKDGYVLKCHGVWHDQPDVIEALEVMTFTTPKGERLYGMGNSWTWSVVETEV